MHYMLCLVSHICTFALDPAELELDEPLEPAPAEERHTTIIDFCFELIPLC
jgi:hypothetical protein